MKSDYFSEDIQEFLLLLHQYEVKYLVIGGEAVIYYGNPRLTGDIDFFFGNTDKNTTALFDVLLQFWDQNVPGLKNKQELRLPDYVIQFGVPPNRIDLLNSIEGVQFEQAWSAKKTEKLLINGKKLPVYFIGLDHLIINKKSANRDKDREDLKYLTSIR